MKWIGLTGGIASGKSTVSKILREMSYIVVDADLLAHEVVEKGTPGLKSVVAEFGADILLPDGSLDRRKMGQQVFGNPAALQKLEAILHPLIQGRLHEIRGDLTVKKIPLAFYDVPLLFEKNMQSEFAAVIVVFSSEQQQFERLRQRSKLPEDEIKQRIASQIPLIHKIKDAHFVIRNESDETHLRAEIQKMLQFLSQLK